MQLAEIYPELERQLAALGADMAATECHGVLCARFCIEARPDPAAWVQEVIVRQEQNNLQVRSAQETLAHLYLQTEQVFQDAMEDFALLLPDDSAALAARMQALVDWCSGFLSGLALSGMEDDDALDPEVKEIVQDLVEITRMDVDVEAGEENEQAFTEIEEYVRIGVMTIGFTMRPRDREPTMH